MREEIIGLLHPGEMGAAVGAVLRENGYEVGWLPAGRSADTRARAEQAGLTEVTSLRELANRTAVILSICPPHAALDVARSVAGFNGTYVDANAVSPGTARRIRDVVTAGGATFVDGGIIGGPPRRPGTRLYLSGPQAESVADLFAGTVLDARTIDDEIGSASALKMCYAAWTKGTAALLLAIRAAAQAEDVDDALVAEWTLSQPQLVEHSRVATDLAVRRGWRWAAEMEEIAATFGRAGVPNGFHEAAAEIFRAFEREHQRD